MYFAFKRTSGQLNSKDFRCVMTRATQKQQATTARETWLIVTLVLRLFLSTRCRKSKKQRWRPKERFHVDFALLLAEGLQENVGGFSLCPPFQNGRTLLGDKAQAFRRLPFSLLLARNCFPRFFLLPFVGRKNARQQVPKEVLTARV